MYTASCIAHTTEVHNRSFNSGSMDQLDTLPMEPAYADAVLEEAKVEVGKHEEHMCTQADEEPPQVPYFQARTLNMQRSNEDPITEDIPVLGPQPLTEMKAETDAEPDTPCLSPNEGLPTSGKEPEPIEEPNPSQEMEPAPIEAEQSLPARRGRKKGPSAEEGVLLPKPDCVKGLPVLSPSEQARSMREARKEQGAASPPEPKQKPQKPKTGKKDPDESYDEVPKERKGKGKGKGKRKGKGKGKANASESEKPELKATKSKRSKEEVSPDGATGSEPKAAKAKRKEKPDEATGSEAKTTKAKRKEKPHEATGSEAKTTKAKRKEKPDEATGSEAKTTKARRKEKPDEATGSEAKDAILEERRLRNCRKSKAYHGARNAALKSGLSADEAKKKAKEVSCMNSVVVLPSVAACILSCLCEHVSLGLQQHGLTAGGHCTGVICVLPHVRAAFLCHILFSFHTGMLRGETQPLPVCLDSFALLAWASTGRPWGKAIDQLMFHDPEQLIHASLALHRSP